MYIKFTIDANYKHLSVETEFGTFTTMASLYAVDCADVSSLTEIRASGDQHFGPFDDTVHFPLQSSAHEKSIALRPGIIIDGQFSGSMNSDIRGNTSDRMI